MTKPTPKNKDDGSSYQSPDLQPGEVTERSGSSNSELDDDEDGEIDDDLDNQRGVKGPMQENDQDRKDRSQAV